MAEALAAPHSERGQEVLATLRTMAELQSVYGVEACRPVRGQLHPLARRT